MKHTWLAASSRVEKRFGSWMSRHQNLVSTFWRRLWGAEQKFSINREKNEKKSGEIMDVGGSSAHGGDLGLNESVTLREIANGAREKVIYEWMERTEKHMETLTTILQELRNEQRGI